MLPLMTRRAALAGLAVSAARPASADPTALPDQPTIVVAGPEAGSTDVWAATIAGVIGRSLQGSPLERRNVGGADGVTGANQFQAQTAPDGATALLAPGTALLSWLIGDPRVRFDAGRWMPLWSGRLSVSVASREALRPGQVVRVGTPGVAGPELALMLTLRLLGFAVAAVPPGADSDVALVRGPLDRAASPWQPAFGFGSFNGDGELVRDPAEPDLPTVQEVVRQDRSSASAEALRAVAAAATLDVALVLPEPSPAALVAWWRHGCDALGRSPAIQAQAARARVQPLGPSATAANLASIAVDPAVLLELRRWVGAQPVGRPG